MEQTMNIWADRWHVMHRWWSVRIGVVGAILLTGIPELSNQYPNLAPTLLAWFPNGGQQWVPAGGVVLAVVARVVSQAAVIEAVRRLLGKKGGDDGKD
jgi:hypothetical protein